MAPHRGSPTSISHDVSGKFLHADGYIGNLVVFRSTTETASHWVICQVGTI
ncbi:hypothetical protein EV186_11212 [Labedaea rhizosphaerae]|uniref:Uncharacterized protein n=1 Tax=Labedaea rhizosphaerae TaxID=598644 RepID=A0A4R6RS43_LABRH|nr:hypothetical protein EV186_11212 [Labedaea rhizosphaerae]